MKSVFGGLVGFVLVFWAQSCSIKLNGGSTQGLTTINIGYFENTAPYVLPTLSQDFTEALKSRIRSTTSLDIVRTEQADAVMTGSITGYSIAPASIQATNSSTPPIAGASALTITVEVKYVNNIDKHNSYEQSFSESKNFTGDIASQQNTLVPALITQITEDIFNKAFANW